MKDTFALAIVLFSIFSLLLTCVPIVQTASPTWNIQKVAPSPTDWCGRGGISDIYLVLDSQDNPHLGYTKAWYGGGSSCYSQMYASYKLGSWNIEAIDSGDEGSLTLDATGKPHIVYTYWNFPFPENYVIYTVFNGSQWNSQTVEESGGHFFQCTLALDSLANPQIIYVEKDGLKYAILNGEKWDTQYIGQTVGTIRTNSIAVDSTGKPHIIFSDNRGLIYAVLIDQKWNLKLIDKNPVKSASIVLTSYDKPFFIFEDEKGLAYASTLNSQIVDEKGTSGSIAIDSNGNPHISYFDNQTLKIASLSGGIWSTQSLVQNITGHGTSIAIDSTGKFHISYFDKTEGLMYLAIPMNQTQSSTVNPTETQPSNSIFTNNQQTYVMASGIIIAVVLTALLLLRRHSVKT